MVHLAIKELANSAEDIIMVTSTIMKDTGGSAEAIYRPNAIRALCRIIDVSVDLDIILLPLPGLGFLSPPELTGLLRLVDDCTIDRACDEDGHRRQEPLRILRRPRVFLPPSSHRQGRREAMAERDPGGRRLRQVLGRVLAGILLRRPAPNQQLDHDAIPCHWPSVPDAHARQDGPREDGPAVRCCWRRQEPRGHRYACSPGCPAGRGRRLPPEADDAASGWVAEAQVGNGQLRGRQGYLRHEGRHG